MMYSYGNGCDSDIFHHRPMGRFFRYIHVGWVYKEFNFLHTCGPMFATVTSQVCYTTVHDYLCHKECFLALSVPKRVCLPYSGTIQVLRVLKHLGATPISSKL